MPKLTFSTDMQNRLPELIRRLDITQFQQHAVYIRERCNIAFKRHGTLWPNLLFYAVEHHVAYGSRYGRNVMEGVELITLLVEWGHNVNLANKREGDNLAHRICYNSEHPAAVQILKLLARHGLDLHLKNKIGATPLSKTLTFQRPNPDVLRFLLDKGADVTVMIKPYNRNLLYYLIRHHQYSFIDEFIEKGCDLLHQDNKKQLAIEALLTTNYTLDKLTVLFTIFQRVPEAVLRRFCFSENKKLRAFCSLLIQLRQQVRNSDAREENQNEKSATY